MEKISLVFPGNEVSDLDIDTALSFEPFINQLRQKIRSEQTARKVLYEQVLATYEQYHLEKEEIPVEEIYKYEALLDQIYACLAPAMTDEKDMAWAMNLPFQPVIFYGTSLFYELMRNKRDDQDIYVASKSAKGHQSDRLRLLYSFVLQKLYNFKSPAQVKDVHAGINIATGLLQYYGMQINTDYIEVTAKGPLPELDFSELYTRLSEGEGFDVLQETLPLSLFKIRGICILHLTDVTAKKAVDNIERVRLNRTAANDDENYKYVIKSLKTLVRNNQIEFDLFPFVRVNNEPVYGYVKGGTGILFEVWGEQRLSPELFRRQAKGYFSNPTFFFSQDIFSEKQQQQDYLDHFRKLGVRSLALMPAFHNHMPVGVLAIHTWEDATFDEKVLALLQPAMAAIGRLLQIYIDEFHYEIECIIKEKFTSIQPAVQWKFNEVAWQYLHDRKRRLPEKDLNIHFDTVYPLYGAVDVRNSTIERNKAIVADLDAHLSLLGGTLCTLHEQYPSSLLEEMIYKCGKWQEVLVADQLYANDEDKLNTFLREETTPFLQHLARQKPATKELVDQYMKVLEQYSSNTGGEKHALEVSMQMINEAVNEYFEHEKGQLQSLYPCYFEKFRTDGVEYDVYIGQSIAPQHPFNHFHLKNLRLWQLSSMAAIARITRALLPQMPKVLRTTQLIFIHNHTIDISFRADERRFDVEGAYNIRYQMIKKRIDKVHIKDTEERLTQPDKIVLIYFDDKDVEDYLPYIEYLQEKQTLCNDLEYLLLEDLQGLSGLKALRVGVVYDNEESLND
jgi:hypothetical protein